MYLRTLPDAGRQWRVSSSGGSAPVWSQDGRQLFYREGEAIMVASTGGSGASLRIGEPEEHFRAEGLFFDHFGNPSFDVAPDGSMILLLTEPSNVHTRVVLNFGPE